MSAADDLHDFIKRGLVLQREVDAQTPDPRAAFADAARDIFAFIMANRERFLAAWIAETGIPPTEAMIVQRTMADGATQVTVERRPPDRVQGSVRQIADRLIALGSVWRSIGKDLYAALGVPLDAAGAAAIDDAETEYKHHECAHIRRGELPAITIVRHDIIVGAPTRIERLATATELCAICSGAAVGLLMQLERSGLAP